MPNRLFFAAAMLALVMTLPVRAAATPEALPPQVDAHIALKSVASLIPGLDAYLVAVTKGTKNEIPPGLLPMLAQMYLPIPLDSWNAGEPLHLVILKNGPDDDPDTYNPVFFFGAPDFADFIASLEKLQWEVSDAEVDKGDFTDARSVGVPDGTVLIAVDMGGGRVAMAENVEAIVRASDNWTPAYTGDADIFLQSTTDWDNAAELRDEAISYFRTRAENMVDSATSAGFKPEVAANLVATLESIVPAVVQEAMSVPNFVMEITFDGDMATLDLDALTTAGSWMHDSAVTLAQADVIDTALASKLPAGAVMAGVHARPEDVLPDAGARFSAMIDAVVGGVLPDFVAEAKAVYTQYLASVPGLTAAASYLDGFDQCTYSVTTAENPEEMLAAIKAMFAVFNTMWAASIADPGLGCEFVGEEAEEDGVKYLRYQLVFKDEAALLAILEANSADRDEAEFVLEQFKEIRVFLTVAGQDVVSVSGMVTDEEFVGMVAEARSPTDTPLMATDDAKALLRRLPGAKMSAIVVDAGGVARMICLRMAEMDEDIVEENVLDALAAIEAGVEAGEYVLAMSLGAEEGWLAARVVLPGDAVSRIIQDMEKMGPVMNPPRQMEEDVEDVPEEESAA